MNTGFRPAGFYREVNRVFRLQRGEAYCRCFPGNSVSDRECLRSGAERSSETVWR